MVEERRTLLVGQLERTGRVLAVDAAATFDVSEDTIRRDLRVLAQRGLARRVRGGALPAEADLPPFPHRLEQEDTTPYDNIAGAIAERFKTCQTIILDNGVMGVKVAERLTPEENTVVITSNPAAAIAASKRQLRVMMIGGMIDPSTGGAVDASAVLALSGVQADAALLGACAVDAHFGVSTSDPDQVAFKKALIQNAADVVVGAVKDRLRTAGAFRVAPICDVTALFVGADISDSLAGPFEDAGVEVCRG